MTSVFIVRKQKTSSAVKKMILAQLAQTTERSAQKYDGSAQTTERSAKLRVFCNSFDLFSLILFCIIRMFFQEQKTMKHMFHK